MKIVILWFYVIHRTTQQKRCQRGYILKPEQSALRSLQKKLCTPKQHTSNLLKPVTSCPERIRDDSVEVAAWVQEFG